MHRLLDHLEKLNDAEFVEWESASTTQVLSAQASTTEFFKSLGSPEHLAADDQKRAAREAFVAVTSAKQTEAERKAALMALNTPPAVLHLCQMLTQFDHDYISQAKEIRAYITTQLLEESKSPDAKIRLRALEMLGKTAGVDSFVQRVEVTHRDVDADTLTEQLRSKLKTLLPQVVEVSDAVVKEDK